MKKYIAILLILNCLIGSILFILWPKESTEYVDDGLIRLVSVPAPLTGAELERAQELWHNPDPAIGEVFWVHPDNFIITTGTGRTYFSLAGSEISRHSSNKRPSDEYIRKQFRFSINGIPITHLIADGRKLSLDHFVSSNLLPVADVGFVGGSILIAFNPEFSPGYYIFEATFETDSGVLLKYTWAMLVE